MALEVGTGQVHTKFTEYKKRQDFRSFLEGVLADQPQDKEIHVILDNYCTHMKNDDWPSGVTSKPAIEGHFKTGQRTITLDDSVLPYLLPVWQVQFGPVRPVMVRPEKPGAIPARHAAGPDSSLPLRLPEAAL